jgi:hypothetical protein
MFAFFKMRPAVLVLVLKYSDHLLYPQNIRRSTITLEVEVQTPSISTSSNPLLPPLPLPRPLRMHNALLTVGFVLPWKMSSASHLAVLVLIIPRAPRRLRSLGQ